MKHQVQMMQTKPGVNHHPAITFLILIFLISSTPLLSQQKTSIQVKAFDQQLQPKKNLEIAFNDLGFFTTNDKGTAIVDVDQSELPIRNVRLKDERLEAASWNMSKGIVEIIIRAKAYRVIKFIARFPDGTNVANVQVSFKGSKVITVIAGDDGTFDLPIALEDRISSSEQFTASNYSILNISLGVAENVLILERPKPVQAAKATRTDDQSEQNIFNTSEIDSVRNLAEFYDLFKKIPIASLGEEARAKIDAKFLELIAAQEDSIATAQRSIYVRQISDSSRVADDIKNLLKQATAESKSLQLNRVDFQARIKVITSKLSKGVVNLSSDERKNLLADIDMLEKLLTENESRFYDNHNDYREIINALKEKYFDIQTLETQLSESKRQSEEERKQFRQKIAGIGAVVVLFGLMIILLMSFSARLRKQTRSLKKANDEIESININLEAIVEKRTYLLGEANKELDTFLYKASHDLRSPIRSIIGLCQIIEHIPQAELVEHVERVSNTMDRVLNKLIDISEIAQVATDITNVHIQSLISSVRNRQLVIGSSVNLLRSKQPVVINKTPVQFEIDCAADLVFPCSPTIVEIILTNLIENAIFFASLKKEVSGRVDVSARVYGNILEITIQDNGVGISESIKPRLCTMFFTGNEASKGNGLGLYTVQKCVIAVGGSLTIDSVEGEYTKVTVTIPSTQHHATMRSVGVGATNQTQTT
jgi:signal transduction histidine kinase